MNKFEIDVGALKSWAQEGERAGSLAAKAATFGEMLVMEILLVTAAHVAGTPSALDWLTGYSSKFKNEDTKKSRKSDAKLVLETYSLTVAAVTDNQAGAKEFEYTRVMGLEKNPDGTFKKDAEGKDILIQETKTAKQSLNWYAELKDSDVENKGFKGFLDLCRSIKKAHTGGDTSTATHAGTRKRDKVTAKQFEAVESAVPLMSAKQAVDVATAVNKQIGSIPNFEAIVIPQIMLQANQLKTSKNPIFVELGAAMIDLVVDAEHKLSIEAKMKQHQVAATVTPIKAPEPAVVEGQKPETVETETPIAAVG